MKLSGLTKLWVCRPTKIKVDGVYETTWNYTEKIYLNLQQDLNELDRNTAGNIDYTIYKGRTDKIINLIKGDGICFNDISESSNIKPDYTVKNDPKIGKTTVYTLNKYNGD